MPNAVALTIDDGQASPVTHTFAPKRVSPESSLFTDDSSVTSAGRNQIILGFSPASPKRATNRLSVRINMPTEQTVDGVTSVAYTHRFSCDIVVPEQATSGNRDDFIAYIKNVFADAVLDSMVADLDPVY